MDDLGMVLDVTHTSDTSLAQALNAFAGPLCATHCNARALCDTPRQLTDDQLKQVINRGGVVGIVTHHGMIRHGREPKQVTLSDLADHLSHICDLAGADRHVGIGSDLDGGYGSEGTPDGLEIYGDLLNLGNILADRGFGDDAIDRFFAGNWLDLLQRTLPRAGER
jgi:membrane dipeptidase